MRPIKKLTIHMQSSACKPETIQQHSSKNLTIAHLSALRSTQYFINGSGQVNFLAKPSNQAKMIQAFRRINRCFDDGNGQLNLFYSDAAVINRF
jgi:hypothetical protein